jgi:hypothetical protein
MNTLKCWTNGYGETYMYVIGTNFVIMNLNKWSSLMHSWLPKLFTATSINVIYTECVPYWFRRRINGDEYTTFYRYFGLLHWPTWVFCTCEEVGHVFITNSDYLICYHDKWYTCIILLWPNPSVFPYDPASA